jgi:hypothetical protein
MPAIEKENRLIIELKEAFNAYRAVRKQRLAERVLKIVGAEGGSCMRYSSLVEHAEELKAKLMGPVYAYYTSYERTEVYYLKREEEGRHVGISLAMLALRGVGYIMTAEALPDGDTIYHFI